MYIIAMHYSHILLAGLLAVWLPLSGPVRAAGTVTETGVRTADHGIHPLRLLAWLGWGAALLLLLNGAGHNALRDPGRAYASLETLFVAMMAWPVVLALLIDRLSARRPETRTRTRGAMGAAATASLVCLPQIAMAVILATAL